MDSTGAPTCDMLNASEGVLHMSSKYLATIALVLAPFFLLAQENGIISNEASFESYGVRRLW